MKPDCKKCGHYSIIKESDNVNTDNKKRKPGVTRGCTAVSLIMQEELHEIQSSSFQDDDGKTRTFEFDAIDTQFRLNENGDCFMWVEQTEEHKRKIKGLEDGIFEKILDSLQ